MLKFVAATEMKCQKIRRTEWTSWTDCWKVAQLTIYLSRAVFFPIENPEVENGYESAFTGAGTILIGKVDQSNDVKV